MIISIEFALPAARVEFVTINNTTTEINFLITSPLLKVFELFLLAWIKIYYDGRHEFCV